MPVGAPAAPCRRGRATLAARGAVSCVCGATPPAQPDPIPRQPAAAAAEPRVPRSLLVLQRALEGLLLLRSLDRLLLHLAPRMDGGCRRRRDWNSGSPAPSTPGPLNARCCQPPRPRTSLSRSCNCARARRASWMRLCILALTASEAPTTAAAMSASTLLTLPRSRPVSATSCCAPETSAAASPSHFQRRLAGPAASPASGALAAGRAPAGGALSQAPAPPCSPSTASSMASACALSLTSAASLARASTSRAAAASASRPAWPALASRPSSSRRWWCSWRATSSVAAPAAAPAAAAPPPRGVLGARPATVRAPPPPPLFLPRTSWRAALRPSCERRWPSALARRTAQRDTAASSASTACAAACGFRQRCARATPAMGRGGSRHGPCTLAVWPLAGGKQDRGSPGLARRRACRCPHRDGGHHIARLGQLGADRVIDRLELGLGLLRRGRLRRAQPQAGPAKGWQQRGGSGGVGAAARVQAGAARAPHPQRGAAVAQARRELGIGAAAPDAAAAAAAGLQQAQQRRWRGAGAGRLQHAAHRDAAQVLGSGRGGGGGVHGGRARGRGISKAWAQRARAAAPGSRGCARPAPQPRQSSAEPAGSRLC
jgi:hypothetical protein